MKRPILIILIFSLAYALSGQSVTKTMLRLPDTGENTSYTSTFGEDADYTIFPPFFILNGNGTVTDTVTGLMWQQTDGGEMTVENAIIYCDTLTLGGYNDWMLPDAHEAFSILNHQDVNPALDNTVFTTTAAEYWWTSNRQANDSNIVWVTNAGGGIGNHPKSETVSAGGNKRFHVRAVRDVSTPTVLPNHFTDNGDGTITDNLTQLTWQKQPYTDTLSWEDALKYADSLTFAGQTDWRLPNIKELQSIADVSLISPSINTNYFSNIGVKKFWSSTTLPNQTNKAWYLHTQFGITTYDPKTTRDYVICVRGNPQNITSINDNYSESSVKIFPNPAVTFINILLPLQSIVEITDMCGKIVITKLMNENSSRINISSLVSGIYIVKIQTKKTITIRKIIKE